jgi:hypothetical protein
MIDFTDIASQLVAGMFSVIAIVVTFICNKKMKTIKQNGVEESYPSLTTHPVHVNIDHHMRNAQIITMDGVSNVGRLKLASDFLSFSISCWKEPCIKFAQEAQECIDNCASNCNECNRLYTLAMNMFSEGRMACEQLSGWNIDSQDYEAVVIFRDKFIDWNRDRLERLARKISDIALINDTYKTCEIKGARILECMDDYLFDMKMDSLHVLSKLNGELNGKYYHYHEL